MQSNEDTIAAIATQLGQAGIGVIRVSGARAIAVADSVFKSASGSMPSTFASHTVHLGEILEPSTQEPIDQTLLTVFRSPHSYTGEDVAEFSCHGGAATLRRALEAVVYAGARHAEPGEFTKRAFLNGKMDLAQAEAVNDLIRAQTDEAQRIALRQLEGRLSTEVKNVTEALGRLLAEVEAAIDFPDDVDEPERAEMGRTIESLSSHLRELLASADRGRIYREGIRVAITGRPNVGKSSLLNALLRESRAIVTSIPGTTRDTIEETVNIKGIPVVAIDTAGLRETADAVEQMGVQKTEETIDRAQIVLLVIDLGDGITSEDEKLCSRLTGKPVMCVLNKSDLLDDSQIERATASAKERLGAIEIVAVSATTGAGIEQLEDRLAEIVLGGSAGQAESVLVSNLRHRTAIQAALTSLEHASMSIEETRPIDLLSVDLMAARNSLGEITGETATDDLIDRIFGEFCIGK